MAAAPPYIHTACDIQPTSYDTTHKGAVLFSACGYELWAACHPAFANPGRCVMVRQNQKLADAVLLLLLMSVMQEGYCSHMGASGWRGALSTADTREPHFPYTQTGAASLLTPADHQHCCGAPGNPLQLANSRASPCSAAPAGCPMGMHTLRFTGCNALPVMQL